MESRDLCPELLSLKTAFDGSSVPFLLFNNKLEAIFLNDSLLKSYPEFENPITPVMLFKDTDEATVLNYLKSEKNYTIHFKTAAGEQSSVVLNAVFDSEGSIVGAFVVFAIKEQSPDFLVNNECMLSVNREFRDRINMMFTSLYGIQNSKTLNPDLRDCEYINSINQNCFQLLRVSDNLARYLRLTTKSDIANFSIVNLSDYLKRLTDAICVMPNQNSVGLTFECSDNNLPVKIDLGRMEFALVNIILNSIKYTREGNAVTVSVKRLGDRAVITISDKGAGMSKEVLSKVGEPYFSDSHSGAFEAGFGIGLFIAKKYIASNGGLFNIQSTENVGTRVTISLPIDNGDDDGELTLNSPPEFEPRGKFSQTSIQLSEVCYNPLF